MSRGPDAATLLERVLLASAVEAGVMARITRWTSTRWAPATFTGCRHEIVLEGEPGDALDRWLDALPDADLPMRHHFVADAQVTARQLSEGSTIVSLAVLTVEES